MKLWQITDILVRSVSATQDTFDGRLDLPYVEALVPGLYARALQINYNGDRTNAANKRIPGESIMYMDIDIDATIQDSAKDFLRFDCPAPVSINQKVSGIVYLGAKNTTTNFCELTNRGDAATMITRGYFQGDEIGWCYEGDFVLVWGNKMLKQISLGFVPQNPLDVTGFNPISDRYPISENLITGLMTRLFLQDMGVAIQQPVDVTSNQNPAA